MHKHLFNKHFRIYFQQYAKYNKNVTFLPFGQSLIGIITLGIRWSFGWKRARCGFLSCISLTCPAQVIELFFSMMPTTTPVLCNIFFTFSIPFSVPSVFFSGLWSDIISLNVVNLFFGEQKAPLGSFWPFPFSELVLGSFDPFWSCLSFFADALVLSLILSTISSLSMTTSGSESSGEFPIPASSLLCIYKI